ncbi:MAG: hypothetical protein WCJ81_09530 [bacterium]
MFFDYSSDKSNWSNAFYFQGGWLLTPNGVVGAVGQLPRIVPSSNTNLSLGTRTVNEAVLIG